MELLDLGGYEFTCADGIVRQFQGVTLMGLFEWQGRLNKLREMLASPLAEGKTAEWLYVHEPAFRHQVEGCLKLNGIQPEWVTWAQCYQLLFVRYEDDGTPRHGWLVELNKLPQRQGKPASLPDLLACIATQLQINPFETANTVPAKQLLATLEAVANAKLTPEQRHKQGMKAWADQIRQQGPQSYTIPVAVLNG